MNTKEGTMLTNPIIVALLAVLCCALWGSAFPCIKLGYKMFDILSTDTSSQILFAGLRFTIAGIMTILIGSIFGGRLLKPQKESWTHICILSIFQTILQYVLFYIGLANTSGVKSSIIEGSNVFISIIIASLIFKQEKLTIYKVLGCIIGFAGVVIVNLTGSGIEEGIKLNGEGFILLSAISYAISSGLIKRYSQSENPVTLSGYQFLLGGIVMAALGILMKGSLKVVTWQGLCMLLYLGFLSAAAYSIWGILLKYNTVSRVSVYGFSNPIFGVSLSAIILNEKTQALGVRGVTALILVCAGIWIVNSKIGQKNISIKDEGEQHEAY